MSNLYAASKQWASRPADERFWSIEEALKATKAHAEAAQESEIDFAQESILVGENENLAITLDGGKGYRTAMLTNWAFGQLARAAMAPPAYLQSLPADLAAQCLDTGLDRFFSSRKDMTRQALVQQSPSVIRSLTSDIYSRFWNHQVFSRLEGMQMEGWRVPPARPAGNDDPRARPATKADILRDQGHGLSIKLGDMIAPAGIYASDHDIFAFMVNEDFRINDGSDGGLSRGFFIQNSEVGASALRVTLFNYRHVCGNHIIWGSENVLEIAVRHVGDIEDKFSVELIGKIKEHLNASARDDEQMIKRAQRCILGATKDEVLDSVFKAVMGNRRSGLPASLSQKNLSLAYETAERFADLDGSPKTAWGFVNGMTRLSQENPNMDERVFFERGASKIMLALAV